MNIDLSSCTGIADGETTPVTAAQRRAFAEQCGFLVTSHAFYDARADAFVTGIRAVLWDEVFLFSVGATGTDVRVPCEAFVAMLRAMADAVEMRGARLTKEGKR